MSVINQIDGSIITVREGRTQAKTLQTVATFPEKRVSALERLLTLLRVFTKGCFLAVQFHQLRYQSKGFRGFRHSAHSSQPQLDEAVIR